MLHFSQVASANEMLLLAYLPETTPFISHYNDGELRYLLNLSSSFTQVNNLLEILDLTNNQGTSQFANPAGTRADQVNPGNNRIELVNDRGQRLDFHRMRIGVGTGTAELVFNEDHIQNVAEWLAGDDGGSNKEFFFVYRTIAGVTREGQISLAGAIAGGNFLHINPTPDTDTLSVFSDIISNDDGEGRQMLFGIRPDSHA